ncbi:DNA alkylation repair protein [Arthrobacter sp. G119Y2]|uniref:DNA alkylation repair protein n=1 Tax=Arthrobacter sp. G119Y2 TaxID=3134965 RepID=UPI003119D848
MPAADELLGTASAQALARAVSAAVPGAALPALKAAGNGLQGLSLRERADLLRDALLSDLPGSYGEFARTIRAAAAGSEDFTGWLIWPVTSAVAAKAVEADGAAADGAAADRAAFDDAMALLAELTARLTSEFAIRTLLRHDLDRALGIAAGWTDSPDADVRRLASEGTRPYLPWSVRVPEIMARPGVTLPLLEALYRDESEYVRRSVANHLNDLSRDHPGLVVETARRWLDDPAPHTAALIRHALRTLIKRGNPEALGLLGFAPAAVEITGPALDSTVVPFGGSVRFTAVIRNTGSKPARLAVDYIVHHCKANGTLSGKTFKLTTATLAPGQSLTLTREHSFRPITTRRYYPGPHAVTLQVNGMPSDRAEFELRPAAAPQPVSAP